MIFDYLFYDLSEIRTLIYLSAVVTYTVTYSTNLPMRGSALFAPYTSVGNPWRCLESAIRPD
jgi:hypothetical protein